MQKITPHLWFDKEAKEAAEFYKRGERDPIVAEIASTSSSSWSKTSLSGMAAPRPAATKHNPRGV